MDEEVEAALMRAGAQIAQLQASERRLKDQLDVLSKNAARYGWLRDTGAVFTVRIDGEDVRECCVHAIGRPAHGLDAAVDSKMVAAPGIGAT